MKIRCSILPIAMKCGGAARAPELAIDDRDEVSSLGTAAHEGMTTVVHGGRPDAAALARKHDVDEKELSILLAQGAKAWAAIAQHVPAPSTELYLEADTGLGFALTGHLDVLGGIPQNDHGVIVDHKTGRLDSDYEQQLRGYGALLLLSDNSLESAAGYVLWIREGEAEFCGGVDRGALRGYLIDVRDTVVNWDVVYRPGKHCTFCPREHECPAKRAMVRRDVAALAEVDVDALASLEPGALIDLIEKASTLVRRAEGVRNAARALVQRQGDIVGGGKRLTLETVERRDVDPLKAFPVLQGAAGFTDAEMAQCVEVSASKAEDVVAKRAGRGKGAAAVRELRAALDESGALTLKPETRLVVRRDK